MSWKNSERHYGQLMMALHWLTLLLIVMAYVTMEMRGYFPKGSVGRDLMKVGHYSAGMTVLFLVVVRVAVRLGQVHPTITPAPSVWMQRAAAAGHLALYVFMAAMPAAGWLIVSAAGKPVPFWGLELPMLMEKNHQLGESMEGLHKAGASIGYFLIGLHAAAALYHHHVVKDDTLKRMLPFRR